MIMITSQEDYITLLEETLRNLESLSHHLEWETAHMSSKSQEQLEIRFDVVPILKKLKEAKKLTKQSIDFSQSKLKKLSKNKH